MNHLYLQVRVVEIKTMRFTPAGIPVQELILEHCGDVIEAGHTRKVEFVIAACAIGEVANLIKDVVLGSVIRVEGFLAAARKNSSKLVLHIQAVQFPRSHSSVVV